MSSAFDRSCVTAQAAIDQHCAAANDADRLLEAVQRDPTDGNITAYNNAAEAAQRTGVVMDGLLMRAAALFLSSKNREGG